jgi:hypothetical protein
MHKDMLRYPASQPFDTSPDLCSEHPGGRAVRVKGAVVCGTIALVEFFNQCTGICVGQVLKALWCTPFWQSTIQADKVHLSLHGKQHTISATWLTGAFGRHESFDRMVDGIGLRHSLTCTLGITLCTKSPHYTPHLINLHSHFRPAPLYAFNECPEACSPVRLPLP